MCLSISQSNFLKTGIETIDNYFSIDRSKWLQSALKIASYCTVIFPVLALISKVILVGIVRNCSPIEVQSSVSAHEASEVERPANRNYSEETNFCLEALRNGNEPKAALQDWVVGMYRYYGVDCLSPPGGAMDYLSLSCVDDNMIPILLHYIRRLTPVCGEAQQLMELIESPDRTESPFQILIQNFGSNIREVNLTSNQ